MTLKELEKEFITKFRPKYITSKKVEMYLKHHKIVFFFDDVSMGEVWSWIAEKLKERGKDLNQLTYAFNEGVEASVKEVVNALHNNYDIEMNYYELGDMLTKELNKLLKEKQ